MDYISNTEPEKNEMLKEIGVDNILKHFIPHNIPPVNNLIPR